MLTRLQGQRTSPQEAKAWRMVSSSMFQLRLPMNTEVQPSGFSEGPRRCCCPCRAFPLACCSYLRTRTQRPESPAGMRMG